MTSWKNVTPDEFTINGLLKCSRQALEKEIFVTGSQVPVAQWRWTFSELSHCKPLYLSRNVTVFAPR